MRPSVPDVHITDSQDSEFAAYRALTSQSVVGLLLGLLSPLALLASAFWIVPALGVFFSVWALRRIKQDPQALTGQKLAWVGLFLSLLLAAAAPADWLTYRRTIRNEARQFTSAWMQFLVHNEPHKAHQLTVPPQNRQPIDDHLWNYYRNSQRSRRTLESYAKFPLVRTLLELGPRANVRFYETADQTQENNIDAIEEVYAVTYEDEGEKKSFFVVVTALRMKLADGAADWSIGETKIGERPPGK
jgi:hypothetical protein